MNYFKRPALACALVGIMAATLEVVKLSLALLPNIEAVTLFSAIFGYCFGILGVIASVIFVFIEPMIYGFGTWFLSYLIYWPLLTLVFALLGIRARARTASQVLPVDALTTIYNEDVGQNPEATHDAAAEPKLAQRGKPRAYIVSTVFYTSVAVGMTFLFGILTSLVEVGIFSGAYDNFLYRFAIYYLHGVWFYIAQIVTNLVLFPLFFIPLCRTVDKIKPRVK